MEKKLSVVVSVYNEEQALPLFYETTKLILEILPWDYELLFVNDGSRDDSLSILREFAAHDEKVKVVSFSRNFGHEAAMIAGIDYAKGDGIVCMDADLQHPPETLISMYHLWEQGWEVIEGVKKSRGTESLLHKESAGFFYGIMSKATGVNMQNASDFKMMDRKAVNSILSMPERNMFFRATSSWVGFKTTYVEFEVRDREAGQSKWSTWSLIKYAFTNIVAFTTAPLQFVTVVGGACFGCSLILIIYSLVQFFAGRAVEGYTTTLIVLLLIGSAIMLSLGIIGYYIAKIYEEVKRRPRYIISQILRGKEDVYQEVNHDCSH